MFRDWSIDFDSRVERQNQVIKIVSNILRKGSCNNDLEQLAKQGWFQVIARNWLAVEEIQQENLQNFVIINR